MSEESQSPGPSTGRRALVSAGAVLLLWAGLAVTLPGVDAVAARGFATRQGLNGAMFSIFGIGVTPIVSAAYVLEVVKLVFPRLRVWEARSERNASIVQRIWLALSLGVAALQAHGIATGAIGIDGLAPNPQGFAPLAIATIVGATALLFWASRMVTRHGLVDGMWLLFVAYSLTRAPDVLQLARTAAAFGAADLNVIAAAVFVALAAAAAIGVVGARVATEGEADRVGALVWPAFIGFYSAALMQTPLLLFAKDTFLTQRWTVLAIFAVLAFLVAVMRSPDDEPQASGRARLTLTVLQIALVIGGSLATSWLNMPIAIDGLWLLVAAAVAQVAVQNARRTGG